MLERNGRMHCSGRSWMNREGKKANRLRATRSIGLGGRRHKSAAADRLPRLRGGVSLSQQAHELIEFSRTEVGNRPPAEPAGHPVPEMVSLAGERRRPPGGACRGRPHEHIDEMTS